MSFLVDYRLLVLITKAQLAKWVYAVNIQRLVQFIRLTCNQGEPTLKLTQWMELELGNKELFVLMKYIVVP